MITPNSGDRGILWRAIYQCAGARWHSLAALSIAQESGKSWSANKVIHLIQLIQTCSARRIVNTFSPTKSVRALGSNEGDDQSVFIIEMAFQYLQLVEQRLLLADDAGANLNSQKFIDSLLASAVVVLGESFTLEEQEPIMHTAQHLTKRLSTQIEIRLAIQSGSLPGKLVFVLGMHRSGTSALSGMLCKSGFSAPDDLMPATESNPRGYWESAGICQLNDEFLTNHNAGWENINQLPHGWEDAAITHMWSRRLLEHIQTVYNGRLLPVIKDPRLSILLRGLGPWLESGYLSANMLLTFRDPLEVARSLEMAVNTPIHKGIQLWIHHLLEAERISRGFPRIVIGYEALLENPNRCLESCQRLADSYVENADQSQVNEFITSELHRQHRADWEKELLQMTDKISSFREIAAAIFSLLNSSHINNPSTLRKMDILYAHWRLLTARSTWP